MSLEEGSARMPWMIKKENFPSVKSSQKLLLSVYCVVVCEVVVVMVCEVMVCEVVVVMVCEVMVCEVMVCEVVGVMVYKVEVERLGEGDEMWHKWWCAVLV